MRVQKPNLPPYPVSETTWTRSRKIKVAVVTGIAVVAIALIIRLSTVFIPVGFALLLAYILEPLITFMDRHHARRIFTVSFVYTLLLVVILGVGLFVGPPMVEQGKDFVSFVKDKNDEYGITAELLTLSRNPDDPASKKSESWWDGLFSDEDAVEKKSKDRQEKPSTETEGGGSDQIHNFISRHASTVKKKIPDLALGGVKAVFSGAGSVAAFVTQFGLTLFYAFFFMLHYPAIQKACTNWIPVAHRQESEEVLDEVDDVVAGFFRGRLLVCVISAVVTSLGLYISNIDFWLLLGTFAGFLGIIPFIGVALTLIPSLLIALTTGHILFSVIGVLVTFSVVQGIVEPIVGPFVISQKVRLHPVTVIIALMAGGILFGILGVLLATPVCGILKILASHYLPPTLQTVLYGENPSSDKPLEEDYFRSVVEKD